MAKFKPFTKKVAGKKPGSKADAKKDAKTAGKFGDWTPPWLTKGKKGKK